MQDDAEKRAIHFQPAVVVDEAKFSELVHEEIYSGAGGANHFRQSFLTHFWDHSFGFGFFSHAGE